MSNLVEDLQDIEDINKRQEIQKLVEKFTDVIVCEDGKLLHEDFSFNGVIINVDSGVVEDIQLDTGFHHFLEHIVLRDKRKVVDINAILILE